MSYVLKELTPLEVGGITFLVRRTWAAAKWAQQRLKAARGGADDEEADDRATAVVEEVVLYLVADWRDVTNEQGEAIPWGAEALGLLDPGVINEVLGKVLATSQEAQGKAGTSSEPGTPSEEASD
jgi:hypothetical protein